MQAQGLDAGRVVSWYGFGWRVFMASPWVWIVMTLLITVIMLILQFIPLVGPLTLSVITPALVGGLMVGAKETAEGRPIYIAHLFKALVDEKKRTPMLILGAVLLVLSILFSIIAVLVVGGSAGIGAFGAAGADAQDAAIAVGALGAGMLLTFLVVMLYGLVTFAVLAYAIPLVMFSHMPPIEAIKSSINASLKNVVPLIVFLIIYFILAMISMIPFFLGFLVLVPVTVAALYASFRDVYAISPAVPQRTTT